MQRLPGIINIYYVLASSLMASIKVDDSTGKVDGDSAATKYTISYTNKVALVPCTA